MGYKLKRATIWRDTTRLPSEYQEVEYIQSSWTQYINTWWTPTIYDTIETKFQTQASASDTNLYGSRYNQRTGVRQDMSVRINTSSWKWIAVHYPISWVSSGLTDTGWFFTSDIINTPRVLKVTPQYCYVDGSIKYTFNVTRSEYTWDLSAYIFWKHEVGDYGDGSKLWKFTVYSFKIWTNDVLVRDFVPCYRKSDSVIGMYDLVTNAFFTNQGTGTFIKGNDVWWLQEKQVRHTTSPWWQPWANTVAYYKFDWDLNDNSGNSYNLSIANWTPTYWTTTGGAKYIHFPSQSYTNNITIPYSLSAYTINVWLKYDSTNKTIMDFQTRINWWNWNRLQYASSTSIACWTTVTNLDLSNWINLVVVNDNYSCTAYVNWVQTTTNSLGTYTDTSAPYFRLNTVGYGGSTSVYTNNAGSNYVSELITEDRVRTAQEIADYYNQTKWSYWL